MIPQVNFNVVNGFRPFIMGAVREEYTPPYATPACLSEAKQALWTNRVPMHEPWPRVMKGDTNPPPNAKNEEYKKNVHHFDQYDNETSPEGLRPIGRVEGDEDIDRGPLWRR
jgi:hypothetical protein